MGDVTFTVTASDAAEIPPGDTGDRDDEDMVCHRYVTVWNATITKCDGGWMPTPTNTTSFTATIWPSDLFKKIRFNLGASDEPGHCMNFGSEGSDDKDLKFVDPQAGFSIEGEDDDRDMATTTSEVNSATVTVRSYDYGAYGNINAEIILEEEPDEETEHAYVVGGGTETAADVPRDDDDNDIADAWQYNTGNATDDNEANPPGDGTNGDGFSRYEEYRGFMVAGTHTRTNPDDKKDVFLCDEDGLGKKDFDATGLEIHMLASDGSEYSGNRVVNFNGDADQCGIYMYDDGYFGLVVGEVDEVGTPNACDWVKLYTESIRAAGGNDNSRQTWEPVDIAMKERTVGHECGHSVNISHHVPETGGASCVIREPCPTQDPVPHTYCTQNPGCLYRWRLK